MAHECPGCFCACHCNGDVDDLVLNYERDIARCNHCDEAGDMDEFDEEDEGEPERMDPETPSLRPEGRGEALAEPQHKSPVKTKLPPVQR